MHQNSNEDSTPIKWLCRAKDGISIRSEGFDSIYSNKAIPPATTRPSAEPAMWVGTAAAPVKGFALREVGAGGTPVVNKLMVPEAVGLLELAAVG